LTRLTTTYKIVVIHEALASLNDMDEDDK